jgi:ribosomal protein S18 acetylase RimI-like enzyme
MSLVLRPAADADLPAIVSLMNAAFRGDDTALPGWSTEAGYIKGVRTTVSLLREEIVHGAQYLLTEGQGKLKGCVSLHPVSADRWYLGALTVSPTLQNAGFGRELLAASEDYAVQRGARTIEMTVVNVRDALNRLVRAPRLSAHRRDAALSLWRQPLWNPNARRPALCGPGAGFAPVTTLSLHKFL